MTGLEPVLDLVDRLAGDVGRARRRATAETSLAYALDRIAGDVESLDLMLRPCAGELHRRRGMPVDDAIALVDRRHQTLAGLLGKKAA